MNPAEAYLAELRDIRASGAAVPETSGYGALANLLTEVGGKLKPKVRCLINLQNAGAGIPDGGLFTANQFPKGGAEPLGGQLPARGAIEAKPVGEDAHAVAESEQVRRYLEKYRQVLVTTYREFVLVATTPTGKRRASKASASPPPNRSSGRSPRIRAATLPGRPASASPTSCGACCCAGRRSPRPRTSPGSSRATRARPAPAPKSATCPTG